ncbi:hypothetical protein HY643_03690 [Candidatus Woesearchaeota archaeon]|nr:hypothetical protein [Candidatus Woesearchaeota archaeon]
MVSKKNIAKMLLTGAASLTAGCSMGLAYSSQNGEVFSMPLMQPSLTVEYDVTDEGFLAQAEYKKQMVSFLHNNEPKDDLLIIQSEKNLEILVDDGADGEVDSIFSVIVKDGGVSYPSFERGQEGTGRIFKKADSKIKHYKEELGVSRYLNQ